MYTTLKLSGQQIIFSGDVSHGYVNDLFMRQLGFMCRKEVYVKKIGELMENVMALSNSKPSTSSIIRIMLSETTKRSYKTARI